METAPNINPLELYESYRAKPGIITLSQEGYDRAKTYALDNTMKVNHTSEVQAEFFGEISGAKISPEVSRIYAFLRDRFPSQGDPELLCEILYLRDEKDALEKIVKFHEHIFK